MRNFKLILEYDGAAFSGWQTQTKSFRTIQSHVEEKLARIFKTKIHCQASGRTDSGVHALAQVAHFKVDTNFDASLIHKALNSFLDKDVSVVDVTEVGLDFHCQKDVVNKTYRYTILNRNYPSALWRERAYFYPNPLNIVLMRKAAAHFKGKHDFKSFQAHGERLDKKNTVRSVKNLTITKEGDLIHITIIANGFLHKMVRNIVGTLLAVGSGQLDPDMIPKLLNLRNRIHIPKTAPSNGLCLVSVKYK